MAVGIMMPQPKQPTTSGGGMMNRLMTLGGLAAGAAATAATGGAAAPVTAGALMQGAATGAGLGGVAGQVLNPERVNNAPTPVAPVAQPDGAAQRRLSQLDQNPQRQIRESIDSLKYVQDPNLRAELATPLLKAQQAARRA